VGGSGFVVNDVWDTAHLQTMTTDKEGERPKHSQHIGLAFLELERQTRTRGGADGVFGQVMTEMTQRVRKRTWIDQVLSKLKVRTIQRQEGRGVTAQPGDASEDCVRVRAC
jgi:hypothetical protein